MSDEQTQPQDQTEQVQQSETTTGGEITVKGSAGQMATFDYGEYANQGSNDLPTSGRIHFLSLLQSSSKALKKGHEKFIEGAQQGMFMLGDELIDGEEGVYFIGIEKEHVLVEMTKVDGTGERVAEHDPNGQVAADARAEYGSNKYNWRSKAGNFLVESIRLYGVVFNNKEDMDNLRNPRCAAIVDFNKTKMIAWEHLSAAFNKCKEGHRPPLFAAKLHLSTVLESRKGHDYYNIKLRFAEKDDFLASLINPATTEGWKPWAEQCMGVAKGVRAGALQGEESDAAKGEGASTDDIPF